MRLALALVLIALPAAAEPVSGPVSADVVRVVDGDSLAVRARPWPGVVMETIVRLRGVDAPELRGKCPAEREAALAAREALAGLAGPVVRLEAVEADKYGGRVLARVLSADGRDVAALLIAGGFARAYGGEARRGWC